MNYEDKRARKRISSRVSAALCRLADRLMAELEDERQFHRYLITAHARDENGKPITLTEEQCFDKLDAKAASEYAHALFYTLQCIRELDECKTSADRLQERYLKAKIAAEESKAAQEEDDQGGIVEIGAVRERTWE